MNMGCLFMSSLICFRNVLLFLFYKFITCLAKLVPKYFMFIDAIVNGIALLISFTDCSLLANRNVTDFHVSNLYTATLPNLLVLTVFLYYL